jgi:hypothetical protein
LTCCNEQDEWEKKKLYLLHWQSYGLYGWQGFGKMLIV